MNDGPSPSDGCTRGDDEGSACGDPTESEPGTRHRPELLLRIAEYDGRSDRATVHPHELPETEVLETWLSVDVTVVEQLDAWR